MLSEEAKRVIDMMKAGWANRPAPDPDKDPKLAAIEGIYAERAMVDSPARIVKVPDRISVIPEMADGVYGEWLRYLEADPENAGTRSSCSSTAADSRPAPACPGGRWHPRSAHTGKWILLS